MFFAAMVVLMPSSRSRAVTWAFRISPMLTSSMRMCPCASRSTSSSPARSSGAMSEHDAFGDDRDAVAAAVAEPLDDRAGQRVDDRLERRRRGELLRQSVSVAPAALPMPSARCPAFRPIATTKYQRDVVFASTIRFLTISTP